MSYDPSGAVPPQPPPAGFGPKAPNEVLAMVSMGTGIAALLLSCCCGGLSIPLGIAALVCGFLGIKKINESNGALDGKTFAIVGMACGGLGLVAGILMLALGMGGAVMQQLQGRRHF